MCTCEKVSDFKKKKSLCFVVFLFVPSYEYVIRYLVNNFSLLGLYFSVRPLFPGFPGVFEWLAGLGAFSQGQGQKNEATRFTPGKAGNFVTLLSVACSIVYFDAWLAVASEFCLYAADVCMFGYVLHVVISED